MSRRPRRCCTPMPRRMRSSTRSPCKGGESPAGNPATLIRSYSPARSATLHSRTPREPFFARLPPDVDDDVTVRLGQLPAAAVARAELGRDDLRGRVLDVDRVDDLGPAELGERPVDHRDRCFCRVAAPAAVANDAPPDLGAGP